SADLDVGVSRLDLKRLLHTVPRDLVARHQELQWLLAAFADQRDLNLRAFGALQHVRYFAGRQSVGRFAIDEIQHVALPDAGLVSRRADKGLDHDGLAVAGTNRHSHAIVTSTLVFARRGIGARIEEIRVGIERPQHAGDR